MTARTILTKMHGRVAAGVPPWAVRTAYAITLVTLPSCIWRIAGVNLGAPLLEHNSSASGSSDTPDMFGGGWWYVIGLSVFSEALAFLSFGLVTRWGEVWPNWMPGLRGRRVPTLAAVIPAGLGSVALLIFPYALVMIALDMKIDGEPLGLAIHGWQSVAFWIAYAPLVAWGPLLGVLTVHYYRRRRAARPAAVESQEAGAALTG